MVRFDDDPARAVADFHTGFNLVLAARFLPAQRPSAGVLRKRLPAAVAANDPSRTRYLDQEALETPPIALAAASREASRMADALEAMLAQAANRPASIVGGLARCGGWMMCRLNATIRRISPRFIPRRCGMPTIRASHRSWRSPPTWKRLATWWTAT
jgi:hypothetical protein